MVRKMTIMQMYFVNILTMWYFVLSMNLILVGFFVVLLVGVCAALHACCTKLIAYSIQISFLGQYLSLDTDHNGMLNNTELSR